MAVRCYGCMKLKNQHPVCEHCGFDETAKNSSHQLPLGTVLGGQYILGKVLGQGGFGITYIAWDQIMGKRVAIKEFFPSGYAGRDGRTLSVTSYDNHGSQDFQRNKQRFLREAESLARFWHIPQIVKILRHFEQNGTAYIAMEFVEGMDLRKYMKTLGRPMTMMEIMNILGPIMDALAQVHKSDLIHRDISPDNIMVLPDGSSMLLDFGAARYVENADTDLERKTSTQAILKHGFAPPEQYRSHGALGPWTDIYAMCATIYFCVTGKLPPEAMNRMMDGTDVEWSKIPGLSKQQRAALNKGMALKPKDRIRSMEELYDSVFRELIEAREKAEKDVREQKLREESLRLRTENDRRAKLAQEKAALEKEQAQLLASLRKEQARKEALDKKLKQKQKPASEKSRHSILIAVVAAAILAMAGSLLLSRRSTDPEPAMQVPAVTVSPTIAAAEPVPELPAQATEENGTQTQAPIPESPLDADYIYSLEKQGNTLEIHAENLDIRIENGRDFTVTVSGLSLEDSYLVNQASSEENVAEYWWGLRMVGPVSLEISTIHFAFEPGQEKWIPIEEMQSSLWKYDSVNNISNSIYNIQVSHTDSSITWTGTFPEEEGFDFTAVEYMEFSEWGIASGSNYFHTYRPGTTANTFVPDPASAEAASQFQGENLDIRVNNQREVTITLSGLKLKDSYLINASTARANAMDYSWKVTLEGPETYSFMTYHIAYQPGNEEHVPISRMEHSIWLHKDNSITTITDIQMTHTDTSITWKGTIPSNYAFDFDAVEKVTVSYPDHQTGRTVTRTETVPHMS